MNEQELLEDLAYTESEGSSDMGEADLSEGGDGYEDEYESDMSLAEDYGESDMAEESEEDYGESDGLFGEDESDTLTNAMGAALAAEDEDEFFGKIRNFIKKAAPIVGRIARAAAPVLSAIPHPYAQIGSKVANVLGKLQAEGATTEDALEAVAELAVRDRRAIPIVAGLAARTLIKNKGASMTPGQRRQAIKSVTRAANTLISRGGPAAIRALPRVAKSVRRATTAKGTPASVRPQVLQRTAANVARKPALLQRLSRPSSAAQAVVRRNGGAGRSYTVSGPARISINVN